MPRSAPGSPKNRIKFLCSHAGKILPRPSESKLKYIGGETRVISVPRDISFHELMRKLTYQIDGEMILKYQAASEDLDALITVKCDEDVGYMRDEIERYESAGITSRLRAFLFPASQEKEYPSACSSVDPLHAIEQRYIDAINGIPQTKHQWQQHTFMTSPTACSSPTSPDNEAVNEGTPVFFQSNNYHHNEVRMMSMHKVHSSPNICTMGTPNVAPLQSHHLHHQQHPVQQCVHHYPPGGYQSSPKPPIDLQRGAERRLISVRSVGRADGARFDPYASASPQYYTAMPNRGGGNGSFINGVLYEDSAISRTELGTILLAPFSPQKTSFVITRETTTLYVCAFFSNHNSSFNQVLFSVHNCAFIAFTIKSDQQNHT